MDRLPVVSAIVPARNEALNIARAVRSLAAQPDVLEIIVANDGSEDNTAAILSDLQAAIPMLRVMNLDSLPPGWLGKPHAAAEGARCARGEWLLFTDADTEHFPGSLRALLGRAVREGVSLVSISPGQQTLTWWEKAVIPLVYVQLARLFHFEEINDPESPAAAANGQYILIRRELYERIGGFAALRAEILDDVALARRVKSKGERILFLPGADWVQTRMYCTFGEMWEGWTKNLFLLYGRSTWRIAADITAIFGEWLCPILVLTCGLASVADDSSSWWNAGVLAAAAVAFWRSRVYGRALQRLGFSCALQKYFMLGAPLFCLMLLNSAWAYKTGGSVQWKGRVYSAKGAP